MPKSGTDVNNNTLRDTQKLHKTQFLRRVTWDFRAEKRTKTPRGRYRENSNNVTIFRLVLLYTASEPGQLRSDRKLGGNRS